MSQLFVAPTGETRSKEQLQETLWLEITGQGDFKKVPKNQKILLLWQVNIWFYSQLFFYSD